jgi:hypothetical protein
MTIAKEEIFGPVLSVIRVETLDDAINPVNSSPSAIPRPSTHPTTALPANTPRTLKSA